MANINDYCRLCADLKISSDLSNMEINAEKRQEIINKLIRFNVQVDFDSMLPKTVCFECINSLERAYEFITTVDLAQEAFQEYEHDNSAPDPKKIDVISEEDNNMDTCNKDDVSVKTEDTVPDDKSKRISKKIELDPKSGVKLKNSKPKSKKPKNQPIPTMPNQINRKRKKPKISANVDLDTWHDYNWICAFCEKLFQNPSELKVHSMQYHMICNPYRCFDCRARGLHLDNFIMHIARHRPVLALTCYQCSLKFESLLEINTHKASHFNTDYVCCGCNSVFSTEEQLDDHMTKFYKSAEESSSVIKNESLKCVICEKTPKSRLLLHRHLLVHTDRKRTFICDTCGGGFYNKKELNQHLFVHTDVRPYKCEVCNFSFKIKHELKKHVSIHFGPKRFACEQCGKCFRLSKELGTHRAIHKDIRPFKCTHCNKDFRFRHLLVQHLRLHSGTKPYSCDHCPLTFRNWSNYNKHTKDMHGIDNSKRKRMADGLYAIDPETREVIYPDKDKVLEWKKKILGDTSEITPTRSDEDRAKEKCTDNTESDS